MSVSSIILTITGSIKPDASTTTTLLAASGEVTSARAFEENKMDMASKENRKNNLFEFFIFVIF
ncbi:MAG: Uncharacterised protein [Acidimicrobiaceae bacterium]|nr:MAG: Uncharacterised protein [Acidimicrobiaceae bacterium]